MIDIKFDDRRNGPFGNVYLNGEVIGLVVHEMNNTDFKGISIPNEHHEKISKFPYTDISNQITDITFRDYEFLIEEFHIVMGKNITLVLRNNLEIKKYPFLEIKIQVDIEQWNKPYSLFQLSNRINLLCNNRNVSYFQQDQDEINEGFGIRSWRIGNEQSIEEALIDSSNIFNEIFIEANQMLQNETDERSLMEIFKFPNEIKHSCQQYLVYFSQFLNDLGIETTTKIEEEGDMTLFSVTPKNKEEALSNIRDALNVYLSLPKESNLEIIANEFSNVGVKQLISNVYHLKSQLLLGQSVLQAKEAAIESLQLSNYQYKKLLEDKEKKVLKEEKILWGTVIIKEYEGKGFKLNLPEIFRKIKRKLN